MLKIFRRGKLGTPNPTAISFILRRTMANKCDTTPSKPLALPPNESSGDGAATKLSIGGSVSMDAMGPIVVNTDGTISRIGNWSEMSEFEKKNTLRIIGKRNQERRAALLAQEKNAADDGQSGTSSSN